eukprot:TRINITY_DN12643_c0_g1_i1.p1 TRINITY_DN12643_c0_g1~~TRINITY_DN12643_c0_g1_i1.p1  ORF type:complete len:385 (-),score=135.16 TRINITY_DN12643_c0_g1_i1:112-1266(-)
MFSSSTLDQAYKIPVLTEPDLGVCPNLVDPDAYRLSNAHKPELTEADLDLIAQAAARGMAPKQYRAKSHVAWMRKQEYMANEAYQPNAIAQYKSRSETMATYSSRMLEQDQDGAKSTEQKVREIEATFDTPNLADLKKKGNPGVHAVKITPILPSSSDIWATLYTQLQFDESPWENYGVSEDVAMNAMIKPFKKALPGFRERAGSQIAYESLLGYMVPDENEPADEQGQLHKYCRNYAFTNEPPEKIFVFTEEADGQMGYNLVEAKLTVHNHHDKSFCTDRVKLKRRKFKRNELEPRRKRQQVMMTESEGKVAQEQDEELYRQEEEEEVLEKQRLQELQEAAAINEEQPGSPEGAMSQDEAAPDQEMAVDDVAGEATEQAQDSE